MLANFVTLSRIPIALMLFFLSPSSLPFRTLYLLCGVTDVLDGFLARKLHTESQTGTMLDSIADLFFAAAYAAKILPLMCIPTWIWLWIALIAAVKIYGIIKRCKNERSFTIPHSPANRLTGILIFLLPLSVYLIDVKYSAVVVCAVATFAAAKELFEIIRMKR